MVLCKFELQHKDGTISRQAFVAVDNDHADKYLDEWRQEGTIIEDMREAVLDGILQVELDDE